MSSPWSPTSHAECTALQQEFSQEIARLNAQHAECLQGAPGEDELNRGSCSKASCQALHTAIDQASEKSSAELGTCRERVHAHLAQVCEEERRQQMAEEQAKPAEREESARTAKREAEQQRDERDRKEQDVQRDRDRKERDARDQRETQARREQEARERTEPEKRESERLEAQAKADRNKQRQAAAAHARVVILPRPERPAEREAIRAGEKGEHTKQDDPSLYERLVKESKSIGTTAKILSARNPFDKAPQVGAREMDKKLLDGGLDMALPLAQEKHYSTDESAAGAANVAESIAQRSNPFSKEGAKIAIHGVENIHRKVLGELDQTTQDIARSGNEDSRNAGTSSSQTAVARASVPSSSSGASVPIPPAPRENSAARNDDSAWASTATDTSNNPFDANGSTTYRDSAGGRTYDIPSGHTLYRSPTTGDLSVVEQTQAQSLSDEDKYENGKLRCSAAGKGRVVVECEKRRKATNPFAGTR